MKNKFLDYFVFLGIVLYSLGFVITLILIYQYQVKGVNLSIDQTVLYVPMFSFGILAILVLFFYYIKKRKNLQLIKMHINDKWIKLHNIGFIGLMISICINIFLIGFLTKYDTFLKIYNLSSSNQFDLPNIWYLYFIVGLSLFLFTIFYAIIMVSIFRIKVDLEIRRMGQDFSKDNGTFVTKKEIKNKKVEVTEDFISFDNKKNNQDETNGSKK